jgi:halocyanin-like protein
MRILDYQGLSGQIMGDTGKHSRMSPHDQIDAGRRRALRTIATGATVGALATVAGPAGTAAAQSDSTDLSEWFANTGNADAVTDRTGESAVTVRVGTDGNGAGFGFGPAVVRVDPGTTVTWEWTGEGGQHDVVAEKTPSRANSKARPAPPTASKFPATASSNTPVRPTRRWG